MKQILIKIVDYLIAIIFMTSLFIHAFFSQYDNFIFNIVRIIYFVWICILIGLFLIINILIHLKININVSKVVNNTSKNKILTFLNYEVKLLFSIVCLYFVSDWVFIAFLVIYYILSKRLTIILKKVKTEYLKDVLLNKVDEDGKSVINSERLIKKNQIPPTQ